ncbi:MAG: hypothetical protein ACKVHP_23940, partial [Verrucomicrobiales bacterium]
MLLHEMHEADEHHEHARSAQHPVASFTEALAKAHPNHSGIRWENLNPMSIAPIKLATPHTVLQPSCHEQEQ